MFDWSTGSGTDRSARPFQSSDFDFISTMNQQTPFTVQGPHLHLHLLLHYYWLLVLIPATLQPFVHPTHHKSSVESSLLHTFSTKCCAVHNWKSQEDEEHLFLPLI